MGWWHLFEKRRGPKNLLIEKAGREKVGVVNWGRGSGEGTSVPQHKYNGIKRSAHASTSLLWGGDFGSFSFLREKERTESWSTFGSGSSKSNFLGVGLRKLLWCGVFRVFSFCFSFSARDWGY